MQFVHKCVAYVHVCFCYDFWGNMLMPTVKSIIIAICGIFSLVQWWHAALMISMQDMIKIGNACYKYVKNFLICGDC